MTEEIEIEIEIVNKSVSKNLRRKANPDKDLENVIEKKISLKNVEIDNLIIDYDCIKQTTVII
jgi:hypothetical protein